MTDTLPPTSLPLPPKVSGGDAATVTGSVPTPVPPSLSVTLTVTLYVPGSKKRKLSG